MGEARFLSTVLLTDKIEGRAGLPELLVERRERELEEREKGEV